MKQRQRAVLAILTASIFIVVTFQNCAPGFAPGSLQDGLSGLGIAPTPTPVPVPTPSPTPDPSTLVCVGLPCPIQKLVKPSFRTEVVLFEDNFIFKPANGVTDLIYRREGTPTVDRQTSPAGGSLRFSGSGGFVHAAQLSSATLRLTLTVTAGEPEIAFAHNGLSDRNGIANANPGLKLVLKTASTDIVDIKSGVTLAALNEALPRGVETSLSISWDVDTRSLRVDLPAASYSMTLPASPPLGGFAFRSSLANTVYVVKKVQTLWQDNRRLLLYDNYDTLRNVDGTLAQVLPSAKLPAGMTGYATVLIDLRKMRSLILFGGNDLNFEVPASVKGFAVRDLATGNLLDVFPAPYNGCMLMQGGGGFDGHALVQSWVPPASLCWVDWNAYDRGDKVGFVKTAPTYQAVGVSGGVFTGFHDSDSALDGSSVRFLRITNTFRGITHFAVHPNIAAFASFIEQTVPQDVEQSHTGAYGMPSGLAVRDKDRAIYEVWAYTTTLLHIQNRGYNLFSNADDWAGPRYTSSAAGGPYQDYANLMPSLTVPGKFWAPLVLWTPASRTAQGQSVHLLSLGTNSLTSDATLPSMAIPTHPPSQVLWP